MATPHLRQWLSKIAPVYPGEGPVVAVCLIVNLLVVAGIMFLYQTHIPKEIAGLLLSGILSDTLLLTLSTTTERDRVEAHRLAEIAGTDIPSYAKELLHASINIEEKTAAELIAADFKEFLIGGKKLGVSQMMSLDCTEMDGRGGELVAEFQGLAHRNNLFLPCLW